MKAALVGHSFPRRLKNYKMGPMGDIEQAERAREFAQVMKVSHQIQELYTQTQCVFIEQLSTTLDFLTTLAPEIINFDIGSNDIARLPSYDPHSILGLVMQLHTFAQSTGPP